ncbi:MAG: 2-amino-4-hydroxy-6-hydroxymethyldihydropteridine diphosphokinase [Candidatus Nitrospinota bacterium M3_3B_026]
MSDSIILEQLELEMIIGVFDWERKTRQPVLIDLELEVDTEPAARTDSIEQAVDYKSIAKSIIVRLEPSEFYLVETVAETVAEICLSSEGVKSATVKVSKPGAVRGSKNVAVRITRPSGDHVIYLGVGGNIEPEKNIKAGLEMLKSRFNVKAASPMYRSTAWGVKDEQPDYLNLAVMAETGKDLFGVRAEIRWIEELLGRRRTLDRFAPRTLDIDLLLYDDLVLDDEGGRLPHPQLLTQQFVYLPMMDIAPGVVVPGTGAALKDIEPEYADPDLAIRKV